MRSRKEDLYMIEGIINPKSRRRIIIKYNLTSNKSGKLRRNAKQNAMHDVFETMT